MVKDSCIKNILAAQIKRRYNLNIVIKVKFDRVRKDQARNYHVRYDQIINNRVRNDQVGSDWDRNDRVKNYFRL